MYNHLLQVVVRPPQRTRRQTVPSAALPLP